MADDYTTIRVTKATRDLINKTASSKGVPVDQLLNMLTGSTKDITKQILLTIDKDKYYALNDMTHILHRMKLINSPKVEDAVLLAIDNLMKGMEKQLQGAVTTQPASLTVVQGQ